MIKMRPHISMIVFYWIIMFVIEGLFATLRMEDPVRDINILLIALLVLLVQCFVFIMIFCNLPYFRIEIGESTVKGPSMLGAGWRKVVIPYSEFSHIVNNPILSTFGFYYIKSSQGKIISVMGFTEEQYKKLLEIISSKNNQLPEAVG